MGNMNEYAPGSHESLETYTVVFLENNDSSEKGHEIYGLAQSISSWVDNKMVG